MSKIINFFDSNFLQTIVTLTVGFVALYVYKRQQYDTKRAAANSIFLEIQHIEKCMPKVKEAARRGTLQNLNFNVIREDSWAKYSHLFSSDFDKEEWETITDFYANARLLDESITETNRSFGEDIAQIRVNKQRILADITKDTLDQAGTTDSEQALAKYNQKLEVFDKLYMSRQDDFAYTPVKYLNDAKKCLEDMNKISITNIGSKFKKIIGIK